MAIPDVAVIGAGAFGSWTAFFLRRAGLSVVLADAWGPAHSRASSGDESRIIRMGYGADAIYTRMARRSLGFWKELAQTTTLPLFHQTGLLWMGRRGEQYTEATLATLRSGGVIAESLNSTELSIRWPQIRLQRQDALGIFEPQSGAIMARRSIGALVEQMTAAGLQFLIADVQPPANQGPVRRLSVSGGLSVHASTFVFACGPWLPKLFPSVVGRRIRPTRQEVFFFAPPRGSSRFAPPHFPAWIDFTDPRGPYGFPTLESRGVKIAFDLHGPDFDPDTGDRTVTPANVDAARAFLGERFPDLHDAPLTESRVCQYENTSNGDFLIDRHPDFPNVWLVGGGSGHGFKHGPAVGEYVTSQILGSVPAEPRFSLTGKLETDERSVY